jgi:hypothetical protein
MRHSLIVATTQEKWQSNSRTLSRRDWCDNAEAQQLSEDLR